MDKENNVAVLKEKLKRSKRLRETVLRDIEDLQEYMEDTDKLIIQLQDELIKALTEEDSDKREVISVDTREVHEDDHTKRYLLEQQGYKEVSRRNTGSWYNLGYTIVYERKNYA